jgi:hypothetical protein
MESVKIRILHMTECPAAPGTIRLVESVAREMGIAIAVEQVLVETPEQAQALAFLGSPTVQADGRDIEPDARSRSDFGLT